MVIRDGQGQELSSQGSAAAAAASSGLTRQQQPGNALAAMPLAADAPGRCSLQQLEQLGEVPDKLYVLKEANASGLASLQQEITPGMLDAWVRHVNAGATAAQVSAPMMRHAQAGMCACILRMQK